MKKSVAALFLIALLGGCASVNMFERAEGQARPQMTDHKRVISDGELDNYARVVDMNQATVGGLLKVQAKLLNTSAAERKIRYKFVWLDAQGMEIPSINSNWNVLELSSAETVFISSVAPSPNARDFILKLLPDER